MAKRVICDMCGRRIPPHAHYIVKIDVYADPEMPSTTSDDLEETDLEAQMKELIEQMKEMSVDELQDQVHRRFEFKLCRPCQMRFLINPLGKPRGTKHSNN